MAKPKFNFDMKTPKKDIVNKVSDIPKESSIETLIQKIEEPKLSMPFNFKFIARDKIRPNDNNDYPQDDIEKLATSILHNGLFHNLEVLYSEDDDMYVLESGERRYRAISYLLDKYLNISETEDEEYHLFIQNVKGFEKGFPCNIKRLKHQDTELSRVDLIDSQIRLIDANEEVRETTPDVRLRNIQKRVSLLKEKNSLLNKEERINVNKTIAEQEGISERQVQKYNNVATLIPGLQEEFKRNNLTLKEGSNLAKLSENEQLYVLELIQSGHKISADEIKRLKETLDEQKQVLIAKQNELSSLNTEINNKNEELLKKQTEISDKEKEVSQKLEQERKQLQSDYEKRREGLKAEIKAELEKNNPDKYKIEELKGKISSIEQSFKGEKEQLLMEKEINSKNLSIKNKEIEKLKKEIEELQSKAESPKVDIKTIQAEVKFQNLTSSLYLDIKKLGEVYKIYQKNEPEIAKNEIERIKKLLEKF